jgi:hypothetical protein
VSADACTGFAALRARAREKVKRVLSGAACHPFTARELAALNSDELDRLRVYSAGRYASLGAEQKSRLRDNLFLALVTLSNEDYALLTAFAAATP